jgi:GT2 family glycosyltransferase
VTAPEISAAVVSYGTSDQLRSCLSALVREQWRDVIVVDNASPDGSAEMVRADFPQVSLIANDRNRGYGAAANQAVGACSAAYVLLLNADAVPEPGAPAALARYLDEHREAAIVGPRLVNPDGGLQPSCYPFLTPANVLLVMSGLNGVIGRIPPLAARHLPTSSHLSSRRVPWVKGAALAIRTAAFKGVGGFDESFFLYGEEHDLCYRLGHVGWETHFAPVATVVHVERASSRGREAAVTEQIYSSLFHFYRRHYSRTRRIELRAVLGLLMTARIARDVMLLSQARDAARRRELRGNISVWRRVLLGRASTAAIVGP